MDDRQPPKMATEEETPGLVWRDRKNGRFSAAWQARTDLVERGYSPKFTTLWIASKELPPAPPTKVEALYIAAQCQHFQSEMLMWSRGVELPSISFNGTLRSLIHCYRSDEDSPYAKNRYHVRRNRDNTLRRISVRHGLEMLSDINARKVKGWHKDWSADGKKAAMGSTFIGQLRSLFSYGFTMLEDPQCERLSNVMHKMRFEGTKARGVSVTVDHANLIRATAHEHFGWHSIAMAQAFQFECTLRQKDVIGEMVPLSEPGISDVIVDGQKWLRGITYQEIDQNLILRHVTSKKQKMVTVDLRLAPMVLEELAFEVGVAPADLTRELLPASGPVVISEITGQVWSGNEFRRKWRKVARQAGIPDNVWNMDSRSGAISEGIAAGAPGEWVRHAATHSDISQTMDYDRGQAEATAKVMRLRVEGRNRPKTDD